MNTNNETKDTLLSQEEIDRLVEEQADDESAWEPPILVRKQPTSPAATLTRFIGRSEEARFPTG